MECDEVENQDPVDSNIEDSYTAVNSTVLNYYKKFGRKRDLEQYFSLSTAQGEIRDPAGLFWRRMKSQSDSSDSGEKKSGSSTELCRISIKCSIPDQCSSQDEESKAKSDTESPPIVIEEVTSRHTDEESVKSDDNNSQKSMDAMLDISINKALSPSSSITSQRKLEWDSLADVGYANESDRKTSASSLSTLERLALKQQYTYNDTNIDTDLGPPTAHSTPLDQVEPKTKGKKGASKKVTKIHKKDVDFVEVNVPRTDISQAINVNLTKHISFNVEKDGGVSVENVTKNLNLTPEKVSVETEVTPQVKFDKEIQTSLTKTKETSNRPEKDIDPKQIYVQKFPVLINLNSLKKRHRKKKLKSVKRKMKNKKKYDCNKENVPILEKSGAQLSEAESFEYMPGHIYNQNQLAQTENKSNSVVDNKSSLESSGALTTDSSKGSKYSFTKDLDKSIELLKLALQHRNDDSNVKKKLIKEIVQRLIKSKYRDDESSTDFLSGLSFQSKKIGLVESHTTTSTSDGNQTGEKIKLPKKSILRLDKFNSNGMASTSQSAPNLPSFSNSDKPIMSSLVKPITSSNTESDMSSKEKTSSEAGFAKTSSEELYQKYLEALRREEAYKRHLRDKENFLRQKLVSSDTAFKVPDLKTNNKLKDLIQDLTRNNYDDGSGDASKLEGGSNSNIDFHRYNVIRKQRSHSVFTLSSGNSDGNRKNNHKKRLQTEIKETKAGSSKDCRCGCQQHSQIVVNKHAKIDVADSSVQVNIKQISDDFTTENQNKLSPRNLANERKFVCATQKMTADDSDMPRELRYVCLCADTDLASEAVPPNMFIYKCSRLTNKGIQLEITPSSMSNTVSVQCTNDCTVKHKNKDDNSQPSSSKDVNISETVNRKAIENLMDIRRTSQSSQTNVNSGLNILGRRPSDKSIASSSDGKYSTKMSSQKTPILSSNKPPLFVHEATRCVQTEISINPTISDPCLTDINIVSDKECATLINETYRRISKPSSENDLNNAECCREQDLGGDRSEQILRTENTVSTEKGVGDCILPCSMQTMETIDKKIQSNTKTNDIDVTARNIQEPKDVADNFTIPIQGTNMTLMVSIGSNTRKQTPTGTQEKKPLTASQAIGTEFINVAEKSTSLIEECSKGVQSQTTSIFTNLETSPFGDCCNTPTNISKPKPLTLNEDTTFLKKPCIVNTCVTKNPTKSNTYPRSVQINELKPLLRSNTDTDRLAKSGCIQTEFINKKETGIQNTEKISKIDTQRSRDTDTDHSEFDKCFSDNSSKQSKFSRREDNLSDEPGLSSKSSSEGSKDPILDIIKDITKRYSKKDIEKNKRNKCFKEIITVLNYLLDTDEGSDQNQIKSSRDAGCDKPKSSENGKIDKCTNQKGAILVDKAVQLSLKKGKQIKKHCTTESSELPVSTDLPTTSSDSATCKVLNRIKKECEKYHQKRCKSSHGNSKKCEGSSSTSNNINCEQCKRMHYCACRGHKCKGHKHRSCAEKAKKKCVAYNLIIQTSDSMISEEFSNNNSKPLQNIVVKVPSKRKHMEKLPFKEVSAKIEKDLPPCSPRYGNRLHRSRSLPNESEVSSTEDFAKRCNAYTVRDYLERNRPDFVERSTNRQNCLRMISESRNQETCCPRMKMVVVHTPNCMGPMPPCNMYCGGVQMTCDPCMSNNQMHTVQSEVTRIANERAAHKRLLSLQLDKRPALSTVSETELRQCARELGVHLREKKLAPKFISEREMKKHSEKIYKSLPEVVQIKEEIKKEKIKKSNLLMANIFKKNLQKKTLRGAVNLSNYSTVIKI